MASPFTGREAEDSPDYTCVSFESDRRAVCTLRGRWILPVATVRRSPAKGHFVESPGRFQINLSRGGCQLTPVTEIRDQS